MENFTKILGNATMAHTKMKLDANAEEIVQDIMNLIEENKDNIIKANEIDVKNNNGYRIEFQMIDKIKKCIQNTQDLYRKVISMNKNENNFIQGKQTDNIGTICLVYEGSTYCLLELILKSILTHNSVIAVSESDYMKVTNELILILVRRILEAYEIDENLIQIIYTTRIDELLSNNVSINKVMVIGSRDLQKKVVKYSGVEAISRGYDYYDIYIEDLEHIEFIKKIIQTNTNIDIYVKKGIEIPFEDYIEVDDLDEAIAQINFGSSGYSSSIFTNSRQNATKFLREVKALNISVNASPLIKDIVNIDINQLIVEKNMFYQNPI